MIKKLLLGAVLGLVLTGYAAYFVSITYVRFYAPPEISIHKLHVLAPLYLGERLIMNGYLSYMPEVDDGFLVLYATKDDRISGNSAASVLVLPYDSRYQACANNYVQVIGRFDRDPHGMGYGLIDIEVISVVENGRWKERPDGTYSKVVNC